MIDPDACHDKIALFCSLGAPYNAPASGPIHLSLQGKLFSNANFGLVKQKSLLLVRKGPTSHLPLHRHQTDTMEIPPTEILDGIFNVKLPRYAQHVPKEGTGALLDPHALLSRLVTGPYSACLHCY
jgi:hypothetical protein